MNILQKIVAHKRKEVAEHKELYPLRLLERSIYFDTPTVSLQKYLTRQDKAGVIAEFKRRSPSKGDIQPYAQVEKVSIGYMQAGASALSILTDSHFFGGKNEDLRTARQFNFCPILRKDFIIDEYQLVEARSIGADVILLIAEVLEKDELKRLAAFAHTLGLEVLMELHSAAQLPKINEHIDIVGINNRNLNDFTVDIQTSLELAKQLPQDMIRISESGIRKPAEAALLKKNGFHGFLI
ncbi:MAG TPA: indole-3-glycerol phosphate synthase TrpC, partial [Bacteroidetes bacterium]|nr:indole-3-glycerol phosphate synthase TrpC [Bacteroidota bacterium]